MSTLLGFTSALINLGSSIAQMRDEIKLQLTNYGWQCVRGTHNGAMITALLGDVATPANLFDVTDYNWSGTLSSNSTLPKWVGIQTSSAVIVTHFAFSGGLTAPTFPKTFTLEYADSPTGPWTIQQTWTNIPAPYAYEIRHFNVSPAPAAAHTCWRINVSSVQSGTSLTLGTVQFWTSDGTPLYQFEFIDVIPPNTETIGDSASEEFIRLKFTGTTIGFDAKQRLKNGWPQVFAVGDKTAGAAAGALTIGTGTVTQSVTNSGWTSKQNLRQLFYDLQASADANFTAFSFEYQQAPPQNADDTSDYIYCVAKNVTEVVGVSVNANVNLTMVASPILPGTLEQPYNATDDLTVDLVSGWYYYMQVNARAFAIASKTNTAVYGPFFGWFRPHADAVSYCSVGPFATMQEAFIGHHDVETPTLAACQYTYVRPSHYYGIPNKTLLFAYAANSGGFHNCLRGKIVDTFGPPSALVANGTSTIAYASGIFSDGTTTHAAGNDFQIHTAVITNPSSRGSNYSGMASPMWTPAAVLDSIYKFIGTTTNEATQVVQDTQTTTTLNAAIAYSDVMSGAGVVTVASTASFPSAGYFIIGDECFQYTAKTSTTFTGVTRAKYATVAANHYVSDNVYLGQWFVKMNGGALLAGNTRPV